MVLGLGLMVAGRLIQRWQAAKATPGSPPLTRFTIDLSRGRDQKLLAVFLLASLFFLLVTAIGSYETYHVTKSTQFCGQACHTVMEPHYVAYQNSPHAQVECTVCHVAPGAEGFVKAKFNGVHQVYATLLDKLERPIAAHDKINIDQKRCEQCHWPKKFVGNLDHTYSHFLDYETNSPYSVRLLLNVGGGDPTHGPVGGIHWHMNIANKVEYIATDPLRQQIPWVRLTDEKGVVIEYRVPDFKDDPSKHTIRTTDCMDCHNRPAHSFRAPNDAVDMVMSLGAISTNLPKARRTAVLALTQPYATKEEAFEKIGAALRAKYPNHPDAEAAIGAVKSIYAKNFFRAMKTEWKLYPNNIGHKDWAGCFRCHDNEHVTADGAKRINHNNCNSCHVILAEGSGPALQPLNPQGLKFKHPEEVGKTSLAIAAITGRWNRSPVHSCGLSQNR